MSIFNASKMVYMNLSFSYKPRAAYLNTSNVKNSIMLTIRLVVMGDFSDLINDKGMESNYKQDTK